jgi:putative ATPase
LASFDKGGDQFYDLISAFHKSVRGSAPDAALYWYCRILAGGGDPLYVARRLLAIASEDIGNADPRALGIARDAFDIYARVGPAEGERAIAQAVLYMASAPKSNAVYDAFNLAKQQAADLPSYDVPLHLRNAPTKLMKELGHGDEYRYAHNEPGAFAAGENYFPPELQNQQYYHPSERGLEKKIKDKLDYLTQLNLNSANKRYGDF